MCNVLAGAHVRVLSIPGSETFIPVNEVAFPNTPKASLRLSELENAACRWLNRGKRRARDYARRSQAMAHDNFTRRNFSLLPALVAADGISLDSQSLPGSIIYSPSAM